MERSRLEVIGHPGGGRGSQGCHGIPSTVNGGITKVLSKKKQMHLSQNNAMYQISHTMQLNKEQFVRQKTAKRYRIFKADTILYIMYDSKSKPWKLFCMLLCHRS